MTKTTSYVSASTARTLAAAALLCGLLLLNSCGATAPGSTPGTANVSASSAPVSDAEIATVTFASGEVSSSDGFGAWNDVQIGDKLSMGSIVKTGKDGECELTFGTLGIARLQADTQIKLRTISLTADVKKTDLELLAGTVANKVSKLSGSDRYQVKTGLATAGVRGTEFIVRQTDAGTTVAVKEGGVAIMPPSLDVAALEGQAQNDTAVQMINASLLAIQSNSGLVSSSEQVTIGAKESAALESASGGVQAILATAVQSGASSAEVPAAVNTVIKSYATQVKASPVKKAGVESDLKQQLDALSAPPIPAVSPSPDTAAASPAATNSNVSQTAALQKLVIKAEPADAVISVDGAKVGTGSFTYSGKAGSSVKVSVTREGYGNFEQEVKLDAASSDVAAKLKALPVYKTISLGDLRAAGALVADKSGFLVKDAKQGFAMIDLSGSTRWTAKAPSSFNTAAYAISDASTVWYAGDKEISSFGLSKGEKKAGISIDIGITGKRPLVLGSSLYIVSPAGLEVFDAAGLSKKQTIALPAASDMTPASYNGKIVLADQSGGFDIVDPASGNVSTVSTQASQPLVVAPVISGSTAVFADRKGLVVAVSLANNSVLWQEPLDAAKSLRVQDQLSVGKGLVFVYAAATLYTLSLESGKSARAPVAGLSAAPLLYGDKLWYGTNDKKAVVADAATGKVLFSQDVGGKVTAIPAQTGGLVGYALDSGDLVILNQAGL